MLARARSDTERSATIAPLPRLAPEEVAAAFAHNITWEDDLWRADPVDVELVHADARRKFTELLDDVTAPDGPQAQARILLFHGQSGAGKTHLVRALRTQAHRDGRGYVGYAQMSPDVANYAEYFLRRLVACLEKPYDPDGGEETALARLGAGLIAKAGLAERDVLELREAAIEGVELGQLVLRLADEAVASPELASHDLDINLVRALLYLERRDPRLDQRVRQFLYGRPLAELSRQAVMALDPPQGQDRAFEMIECLGKAMWALDGAALVFTIDQVEDLRFFENPEERFQKAIRDLIQIANRVPRAIVLISCLGDFYSRARERLAQSYIDRIERSGPVLLAETRSADEVRLLLAKRLHAELLRRRGAEAGGAITLAEVEAMLPARLYEELKGLSPRRLLESAGARAPSDILAMPEAPPAPNVEVASDALISSLAAALGDVLAAAEGTSGTAGEAARSSALATVRETVGRITAAPATGAPTPSATGAPTIDYREPWERFLATCEADVPSADDELLAVLLGALAIVKDEWNGLEVHATRLELADDVQAADLSLRHPSGHSFELRTFVCNRSAQGGALKRQLERVLASMGDKPCVMLRSSDLPGKKNQTTQQLRTFRERGGRFLSVPLADWERLMLVREFHAHHRFDPGFAAWFGAAKLMSGLPVMASIARLDLLGRPHPRVEASGLPGAGGVRLKAGAATSLGSPATASTVGTAVAPGATASLNDRSLGAPTTTVGTGGTAEARTTAGTAGAATGTAGSEPAPTYAPFPAQADWTGWETVGEEPARIEAFGEPFDDAAAPAQSEPAMPAAAQAEDDVPISVLLDEWGEDGSTSILAGREQGGRGKPVSLNKNVLKRHTAVLGGSGSGKTTLALSIIEQVLLRGIPVVLLDRKGDLCSYANPDVWRVQDGEQLDRRGDRERLSDAIDVAVYTPGRASGRPISITLLPTGIGELPEHEQQLLANMSAAALGDMLHLKNSATNQKQSGVLSVALRILGSRSRMEVTLGDLIALLEDEDPELGELTQRMDPSGRIRRDLVGQLDSLRHRNASLFDGGGESLKMEALLGLGPHMRAGRTRLSVIYTGFLGDNENILFWVAQFLSEALRFCQRNPNDELQAVVMLDEADLYIPATAKPATSEPLQSLLKRARSAGLGIMLATQSPGDLDYRSRDQITSWFIGRVREDTALKKLRAAFQSDSGLDPAAVLPHQTVGEFHLLQEGLVRSLKAQRSLIAAEQVPFDRIEQLARETKGQDERQLKLFG
jgi:hypothetical protein